MYHWRGESYQRIEQSDILPDLDLPTLAQFVIAINPLEAVLEFREKVREITA